MPFPEIDKMSVAFFNNKNRSGKNVTWLLARIRMWPVTVASGVSNGFSILKLASASSPNIDLLGKRKQFTVRSEVRSDAYQ